MLSKRTRERSRIKERLELLRFLNQESEASLYLYDIAAGKVYFADRFDEKYGLPSMTDGSYPVSELLQYLRRQKSASELPDIPEEIQWMSAREYSLTIPGGESLLMKNELRVEYSDSGRPVWGIGRLMERAAGKYLDSLTGLFDAEKLAEDLKLCCGSEGYLAVLGIDNFRDINTRHGRGYGNQIILDLAGILDEEAGKCIVYRLESDKFAIHATHMDRAALEELYGRIQKRCAHICTLSAGVSHYDANRKDMDELYQQSENMLSLAKEQGKNMMLFYSADLFARQLDLLELQDELRASVAKGCEGFFLTYQPQILCGSFEIFGAEALLRFRSPLRGLVRPDEFIPILERTGLIVEVGAWVLATALKQCRRWREALPRFHISINVSYLQLRERGIADRILEIVEQSGVPGSAITLEVTESVQLQDFQRYNKIFYKLQKCGIQIAIDDFGTGYSNLSYLKRIAIDEIKIDRCFVNHIQHSSYQYRLMSNIVELARSADIRICCEGVETEDELAVLRELNPDLLQGYLFSMPCEVPQFEERYLNSGSQEFIQCRRQEARLRGLKPFDTESMARAEQARRGDIVDGMEELVYIRAMDSYALLYMNAAGRELTGMYDYKGCKCYKVLCDRDAPCENCPNTLLSSENYHVRETWNHYLNRHFLFKEKSVYWQGKPARLCVAIDVTEREVISQSVREQLEFAQNIVNCTKLLLQETDIRKAISGLLKSIGTFYQADRAYLFELRSDNQYWENTYEWCSEGITPQIRKLSAVPISITKRWLAHFHRGESVVIDDMEAVRRTAPEEWEVLQPQGIRNLVASPIWRSQEIVGFLGLDNPRAHVGNCGQIETIACFLADRLVKDETNTRLRELLNLRYEDILKATDLGLWVIQIPRDGSAPEMYVDRTMGHILGIRDELTPQQCYEHWYNRISEGYYHYVGLSVQHMIGTGKPVELSYTWNHPLKGQVTVRCLGIRMADMEDRVCLEGYHREINQVDMPRFLPDPKSIIFEYNENSRSIYFHNSRGLLAGTPETETGFPDCWLESGMVHPHFTEKFRGLFEHIHSQAEVEGEEFLLKSTTGKYEWFKLKTKHLGQGKQDVHTMIVILDPATQERAMELELLRLKDFYGAILSEKVAYAEIDMESYRFLSLGGLWSDYADEENAEPQRYDEVLLRHADLLVHLEDQEAFRSFIREETLHKVLEEGRTTEKLQLRRLINGEMRWVELTGHVFRDQLTENNYALLYMKDIDVAKRHTLAQELAATRDSLTKLYNRATFEEEVTRYMLDSGTNKQGTLLLIDMDHFKQINDTWGHTQGDQILRQTSEILLTTFRRKDLIGRFGGDEFLVFLKDVTDRSVIERRVGELREALHQMEGGAITCSIGAVEVHTKSFSYDGSLHLADMAMYRSKEQGRDRVCYYGVT